LLRGFLARNESLHHMQPPHICRRKPPQKGRQKLEVFGGGRPLGAVAPLAGPPGFGLLLVRVFLLLCWAYGGAKPRFGTEFGPLALFLPWRIFIRCAFLVYLATSCLIPLSYLQNINSRIQVELG